VKLTSFSLFGNVKGSLPLGFTSPKSIDVIAFPISYPGMKLVTIPFTLSLQSVKIAPGVVITTTVFF